MHVPRQRKTKGFDGESCCFVQGTSQRPRKVTGQVTKGDLSNRRGSFHKLYKCVAIVLST